MADWWPRGEGLKIRCRLPARCSAGGMVDAVRERLHPLRRLLAERSEPPDAERHQASEDSCSRVSADPCRFAIAAEKIRWTARSIRLATAASSILCS